MTFLNVCETKGDPIRQGRGRAGRKWRRKPAKGADMCRQGVSPAMMEAAERPRVVWTQRPFDSGLGLDERMVSTTYRGGSQIARDPSRVGGR